MVPCAQTNCQEMIRGGNKIKGRIVFFLEGYSCQVRNWILWLLLRLMKPASRRSCCPKFSPVAQKNLFPFQSSRNSPLNVSVSLKQRTRKGKENGMKKGRDRTWSGWILVTGQKTPLVSGISLVSKIKYSVSFELRKASHHSATIFIIFCGERWQRREGSHDQSA